MLAHTPLGEQHKETLHILELYLYVSICCGHCKHGLLHTVGLKDGGDVGIGRLPDWAKLIPLYPNSQHTLHTAWVGTLVLHSYCELWRTTIINTVLVLIKLTKFAVALRLCCGSCKLIF